MTTSTLTATKPIDKMLQSFPGAIQKTNGYWEHNPGYGTHFDFWEKSDGKVALKIWNGADYTQVLSEGTPPLKPVDLYPNKGKRVSGKPLAREKLDLLDLADYLKLDHRFLFNLGYRDSYVYTNKDKGITSIGVKLGGYCNPNGSEYDRNKVRLSLNGNFRFVWDESTPGEPIPCGLHRLDDARRAGYLFLDEGESDWATFMFHGFPALGISGADAVRSLDVSLLADIPRIYIIEEPDQVKKNQDAGKGFYKNVRAHLRDNGYTGEIFTIRWKQVTGCKDPSELHKVLYTSISLPDETVFCAEIRKRFAAVIEQAMLKAIPEGITSLTAYTEDPDPDPEKFPRTNRDLRQWITELNAVPAAILSLAHKIALQTIMLHTQWWDPEQERWFKIDAPFLAKMSGMSKDNFLDCVAYLTEKLGLFVKKRDTIWHSDMDAPKGKKKCTQELYIHPAPQARLIYPVTYHVIENQPERKHGGKQKPGPKCIDCGRENINEDIYKAHYCRDCHSQHMFLQEGQSTSYSKIESESESESQLDVYSFDAQNGDPDVEPEEERVNVNMTLYKQDIYSESKRQVDVYSFESESEELNHIAHEFSAHFGEPCLAQAGEGQRCGSTLYWMREGRPACCSCTPKIIWNPVISKRLRDLSRAPLVLESQAQ